MLIQEIDRYLEQCTAGADQARNRNVFWLYYRGGLSASAIAALPEVNLTTKGVESVVLRITRDLRHRIVTPAQDQMALREKPSEGICPA